MDLVIDANILFAALIKANTTHKLLLDSPFNFYTSEVLFQEFEKYKDVIVRKTDISDEEFERALNIFRNKISTIPNSEAAAYRDQAKEISPDEGDTPYLAVALKLNISIWSNDKAIKEKQDRVKVYNTEEIIKIQENLSNR